MQDSNTDNTIPTQPNREPEETRPTRVQPDPIDPTPVEVTRPNPVARPEMTGTEVTQAMPVDLPPTPASAAADTIAATTAIRPPLNSVIPPRKHGTRRWPWVLLGLLMIFVLGGAGGWMGYRQAIQIRKDKQVEQQVNVAKEHFMLGLVAQGNKQYEIAKLQFEYVIRKDPTFPGASDKLREVMMAMAIKATPTIAPTVALPTMTPTKDTRPQEDIYNQARAQYAAQDWTGLFSTIDSLRQIDPKFHAVEVDDMLYMALRFRGIDKILHQANLEGGLYDLALAEKFGPLDVDAKGYRQWARQYLNGSTFWEVDWQKVMDSFEQIYPYFPNMRDASGLTAIERYRLAAKNLGDELQAKGDNCAAFDAYEKSLKAVNDATLAQKATEVYNACHPPTAIPTATETPTPTVPGITPVATTAIPVATVEATKPSAATATTAPTAAETLTKTAPTAAEVIPTSETPKPPAN